MVSEPFTTLRSSTSAGAVASSLPTEAMVSLDMSEVLPLPSTTLRAKWYVPGDRPPIVYDSAWRACLGSGTPVTGSAAEKFASWIVLRERRKSKLTAVPTSQSFPLAVQVNWMSFPVALADRSVTGAGG